MLRSCTIPGYWGRSGPVADEYLTAVIEEALEHHTTLDPMADITEPDIRHEVAGHVASHLRAAKDPMREGPLIGDDVHVDWHMTPDEWTEMRGALLNALPYSPYVQQLHREGKLRGR